MNNSGEQAGEITHASYSPSPARKGPFTSCKHLSCFMLFPWRVCKIEAEILLPVMTGFKLNANKKRILCNWKQWNVVCSFVPCVQPDITVSFTVAYLKKEPICHLWGWHLIKKGTFSSKYTNYKKVFMKLHCNSACEPL